MEAKDRPGRRAAQVQEGMWLGGVAVVGRHHSSLWGGVEWSWGGGGAWKIAVMEQRLLLFLGGAGQGKRRLHGGAGAPAMGGWVVRSWVACGWVGVVEGKRGVPPCVCVLAPLFLRPIRTNTHAAHRAREGKDCC